MGEYLQHLRNELEETEQHMRAAATQEKRIRELELQLAAAQRNASTLNEKNQVMDIKKCKGVHMHWKGVVHNTDFLCDDV